MEEESGGTPNPLNPNIQNTETNVVDAFMAKMNLSVKSEQPADLPTSTDAVEPEQKELVPEKKPVQEEPVTKTPTEKAETIQVEASPEKKLPVYRAGVMDMVKPAGAAKSAMPRQIPVEAPVETETITQQPEVNSDPMETLGVVTDIEGSAVTNEMFDPAANRPMEKAPASVVVKPKRRKLGLIIAMIASLFVAIACGVIAILILNREDNEDKVAMAMNKLVSENSEKNALIDGTINLNINDPMSQFSGFSLTINSQMIIKTLMNSTTATLDANLKNGESFSVQFDGLFASGDELYLKVNGAQNLASILNSSEEEKQVLSKIDNVWLKVSFDDLKLLRPNEMTSINLDCTLSWLSGINNNMNSLKRLYTNNPFVGSTNENITIASVNNPVRKFIVDEDNFGIFLNKVYEIDLLDDSTTCKNNRQDGAFSIDEVMAAVKNLPDVYLEVDDDQNFTRVYSAFNTNSKTNITIDLNLSYPKVINISEPIEFKVFSAILQGEDTANETEAATEKQE